MRFASSIAIVALTGFALTAAGCSDPADESTDEMPPIALGTTTQSLSSSMEPVASFGSNPGGLKLYKYVPKNLPTGAPLVLVLHGCTEGANDAAAWGWNELADANGFAVGYPEQTTANNQMQCFNWGGVYGDMSSLARGKGENESIKQMVDTLAAAHGTDPKRTFIVGFSAGGGTALVTAATWPEKFAAVASLSGLPFGCPASYSDVFTCQNPGVDKTAAQWGDKVRAANPGYAGSYPRVSVWQGASDTTVGVKNRTEIVKQWTNVLGLGETPTASSTVDGAKYEVFKDGKGVALVESYEIPGMAHGVALAPNAQCGQSGAKYTFDKGICSTTKVAEFFGLTKGSATPAAPTGTTPAATGAPNTTPPPPGTFPSSGKSGNAGTAGSPDTRSPATTCSAAPGRHDNNGFAFIAAAIGLAALIRRYRNV